MRPEGRWLAISVHDVAPATWSRCEQVLQAIAEVAPVPSTLLVVPAYHGQCSAQKPFEEAMSSRLAAGDELALHGYFHRDTQAPEGWIDWLRRRVYTAGEGEFAALSEREAGERLLLGRRWFAANHWPVHGFVAPAWLLGPGAWQALRRDAGFEYTTTLTRFHLVREGRAVRAPCLTYSTRSAWRAICSRGWNRSLQGVCADSPVLRLALHPNDAQVRSVRRSWQRILERLLRDRQAVTKLALARALCHSASTFGHVRRETGTAAARISSIA